MNPNIAVIFGAVAVGAIVLAIFGASWLNQRATEKLLEQMEKRFDAKLEAVRNELLARIEAIQLEFRAEIKLVNQRLGSVEATLARVERQLEAIFKPVLPPRN
jgi:hypothetical protein